MPNPATSCKYAHWRVLLADVLQQRLTDGGSTPARISAVALAGAALASLESAQEQWVADGNQRPLDELVDEAMNAVAPVAAGPTHNP